MRGVPVYVMLPLDTVWLIERDGRTQTALLREKAMEVGLEALRAAGVEGVMVSPTGPGQPGAAWRSALGRAPPFAQFPGLLQPRQLLCAAVCSAWCRERSSSWWLGWLAG